MSAVLAPALPRIPWIRLWSRLVNRIRLAGRFRHLAKVRRSHALIAKLTQIAGQENGHARVLGYLRKVDPYLFEEALLTAFENANIHAHRNPSYSGDGGLDGALTFRGRRVLIQAKRYRSHIIAAHVLDFAACCLRHGSQAKPCRGGLFIHTGRTGALSRAHTAETALPVAEQYLQADAYNCQIKFAIVVKIRDSHGARERGVIEGGWKEAARAVIEKDRDVIKR